MHRLAIAICGFLALALAGCSGQMSTAGGEFPPDRRVVYPITAEQADKVLTQAMTASFPDSPISSVALPGKGYTATIRFALDSHQITAVAVPAQGRGAAGPVNGYEFRVMNAGTMPITGNNRSVALFKAINDRAAAVAAPVPAVPAP